MSEKERVVIVPCSGIGKTYGSVSREAAYLVVEDLRPEDSQLVALSMLAQIGLDAQLDAIPGRPWTGIRLLPSTAAN